MHNTPKHVEITDDLRSRILTGEYGPGDSLPTIRELAEAYGTSYFTVQTALTPLVEERLIERRRRTGTVVRNDIGILTRAAIYCSREFLNEPQYAFARELSSQLQRQCEQQSISTRLFTDLRPESEKDKPLPELLQAVATRGTQAVFVPLGDSVARAWLTDLSLPIAFIHGGESRGVTFSTRQLLEVAMERLRATGCRSVGLISPEIGACNTEDAEQRIDALFLEKAGELSLDTETDWVSVRDIDGRAHEAFGYEALTALWALAERPDGLLVYPDTVARGVTTALLEQGIRVPEDLKLVFHRNAGIEWPCPPTVDWVSSDVTRWAAEMIAMVQRQIKGEPVEPVVLDYELQESGR